MSSPNSSSSATAGKRRWTRLRPPRRRTLVEWGAAALVAAALYIAPGAVLRVIAGAPYWSWLLLVAVVATLALYAWRTGRPLAVLGLVVMLGVGEFVATLGAALGNTCGTSDLATGFKVGGVVLIPLAVGTWCVRRGRLWLSPLALVAAPLWVVAISYVIPGGSGGCFD